MRNPKPWYRKSVDAWFAQVNRRQIRLANGRDNRHEAKRKLAELLLATQPVKTDVLTLSVRKRWFVQKMAGMDPARAGSVCVTRCPIIGERGLSAPIAVPAHHERPRGRP